ncbi:MAG TPA: NlpC/P60 family protein [Chthoniobacter sp.]|nr:NlpC/P60 family protein [Chthoniobacter sp.]
MTTDPRNTAAPRSWSFLACVIYLLASIVPGTCALGQESKPATREDGSPVKSHSSRKKKSAPAVTDDDASPATPKPKPATDPDSDSSPKKKAPVVEREESPFVPEKTVHAPAATIETGQLADFAAQPPAVQQLISAALELTKMNLTYTYGSSDPASGGMDCSGTIYHLLRSQGFKDVPRDSSSQYIWARQRGQFFAVVSTEADGFEFQDLQPGDLMFWSGTYQTSRTVPISHVMLYLGREKASGKRVMFGSSDGRSYNGIQRWGVSVFDFKMPKMDPAKPEKHVDFVGYAHIPALRDPSKATVPAPKTAVVTAKTPAPVVPEETPSPQEVPAPVLPPSDALREPPRGSPERKAIMDALRAEKFPGKSNEVIFQVQSLKVHGGWAWAQVTPQTPGGKVVANRILALLRLEEGQWKSVDLGEARVNAKAGDSVSRKKLVEMFPSVPTDILPKLRE